MSIRRLERVFNPKSIALVGASPREGSTGRAVLDNLLKAGFAGKMHFVNPRHADVDGVVCVPSLSDIGSAPDLVIVTAPRELVRDIVREAGLMGVPGALVMSDDFTGPNGELSNELKAVAKETNIRIIGPGSLGLVSPRAKLNASILAQPVKPGDLAVISQSSAITSALASWAHKRNVGFSGLVSVGSTADVNFADLLDFYALDPTTRAILIYVERLTDPQSFMSAARAASRVKPVIAVKSGRVERRRDTGTHTGNLATSDAVYDAAFRRAGLLRVMDIDELFDAAEALGRIKPFPGRRLAILTNGRAIGQLAADRLLSLDGNLAHVSLETTAKLMDIVPGTEQFYNPINLEAEANASVYASALEVLLADKANDAVMVMNAPTAMSKSDDSAKAVADTVTKHRKTNFSPKPVFTVWFGASEETDHIFEEARIPHYETGGVRGFMHLVRWTEAREFLMSAPPSLPVDFQPNVAKARNVVQQAIARGHTWLAPVEITALLEAYDIPIAPARFARTPEEAAELARLILGTYGSCVIKVLSRDIPHKSDVGGVVLDLKSVQQVADATRDMLARVAELAPAAEIEGVTVHPMIKRPHARELLMGIADDPTFGPVVLFGRGGKAVEVIHDRALALPPLDLSLANDLIERTRVVRALRNYRDVPAADTDAVALTLVKLAQLAADVPEVLQLDLNPVLADEDGVVVVDARVSVAPFRSRGEHDANPRFAVAPYPKSWEHHTHLKDGTPVFIRPVRPEDEDMYREFFGTVTAEDLRLRFFAPVKEFSHAFIARLTQIDYGRAYALAAISENDGKMLGGVRLMLDNTRESGEYAILLSSHLKGQGLGWKLMKYMIEFAEAQGLRRVEGQVLSENTTMLKMCAALGFKMRDDPHEHGVKLCQLELVDIPTPKA